MFSGLRFDLMLTAYLLAPVLIICSIRFMPLFRVASRGVADYFSMFYMKMISIILFLIAGFDFDWLLKTGDRLNSKFFSSGHSNFANLNFRAYCALLALGILSFLFRKVITRQPIARLESNKIKSYFLVMLVLAILARGSFGEHHLDLRHAEVTQSEFSNHLIIPSAYALDQALRNRR